MEKISQTEAHQLERRVDAAQSAKREQKSQLSSVMGAAFAGYACGYMVAKNPSLSTIGPGKKIHLRHVIAGVGIYLGRKKGKMNQIARGAGLGALFAIAEQMGAKAGSAAKV